MYVVFPQTKVLYNIPYVFLRGKQFMRCLTRQFLATLRNANRCRPNRISCITIYIVKRRQTYIVLWDIALSVFLRLMSCE